MRLSELVSRLSPSQFTEIATLIFLTVFIAITIRALRRSARPLHEHAVGLPLSDDAPTYEGARGSARADLASRGGR